MGVSRRWRVEEVPSLSVQSLKGFMDSKRLSLSVPGKRFLFIIETYGNYITIDLEGGSDPQVVYIDYTAVGYGKRPWFCCPFCNKRCGKLYRVSGVYGCRRCHELTYATCQLSGNRLRYLSMRVRRLQRRLGMNVAADLFSPDYVGIDDTPTFKPKYMKQQTFDRLRLELEITQLHRLDAWLSIVI